MYVIEPKPILNSDKFRQAAIHFQKYGYYTAAPVSTTAYLEYWREERTRCLEGYYAEDGDWISGYHYFYLNYCPILLIREETLTDARKHTRKIVVRKRDFPDFWDSDYDYFMAIENAEREGKHLVVLKARGKGYSFKGGSMLCRNYFLIKESKSYAIASEMEYLTKDGLLSKAWEFMDFIDQNTGWAKKRQKLNKITHRRASYLATDDRGIKTERGYLSEIMGISLKNDPDKARGKRGKLILWEEGGKFPDLVKAWQIAQPSVERDGVAFGLMIAYGTGGCLTEGNKVWTADGNLIDVKDVTKKSGILGFSGDSVSKENVTWLQPPSEKPCVKITTNTRRVIECSTDHPILTAIQNYGNNNRGRIYGNKFVEAKDLSVGNKVAIIDEVPIFGSNKMWEPRVVGWLIGDGSYGKNQQPRISNCEEEINEYIESKFDYTTNIKRFTKGGKVYKETAILACNENLRKLGIYGQTKLNKTFPSNIHIYSKEDLQEFIGGLFDTDGYVAIRKNKSRNTWIGEISISSASEALLNELRFLLQKFGIHGRIRERLPRENNTKDRNNWYEFTIADTVSLLRFIDNIKLFPKEKQTRLDLLKQQFEKIKPHAEYAGYRYEEVISIEYTGIKPVYNLTAGVTHTYIGNGIITHNTEEADYEGLKELFLYPDGYNALPLKNVWDDGGGKCGFFVPEYVNMYGEDKDGHQLMDEGGNTDYHTATRYALALRDVVLKGANDRQSIDRYIAEHPFTPTEACLQLAGNIFPKEELIRHLAYVRNTEALSNYKQVGDLDYGAKGTLVWTPATKPRDITKYRLKSDDNKKGQIVIWEHPVDDPPYGLYIAGCLTPGEKVLTDRGLVSVEDVTLKDRLINKEGNSVRIRNLQRRQKDNHDVFKFKMSNTYRTTTFTRGHPLFISKTPYNKNKTINEKGFDFKFTRADKIEPGDWTKWPNVYNTTNPFDISTLWTNGNNSVDKLIENPLYNKDFWWFVGLWLGDGCCYNDRISISYNKSEKYYVDKTCKVVKNLLNRSPQLYSKGENVIECNFNFKQLSNFLTLHFGKYAHGKFLPEWVKRLDPVFKRQLLLGYLDSDGCVTKHTKGYYSTEFVSVSLELLEGFQDILFSLGIISGLNKLRDVSKAILSNREINQKKCYHLRLSHHSTLEFAKQVDCSEDLKIKRIDFNNLPSVRMRPKDGCFFSQDLEYIYFQIKEITHSLYTGTVYNFECDTHNYISHHISQKNCDPYDHDQAATSDSLGSVFIYKRFQNFESYYDTLVAEFTGRPNTVNEFYETVRKLLLYYNAKLLYENEKPGLFAYFTNKHSEHLLADQPDIIKNIIKDSKVNRSKGIHMAVGIKDWAELKARDWLNEEYEPGKKNLTKILSEALLEELISYNRDGNFDRVIAFMLVMVYKEELHNRHVKQTKEEEHGRNLFKVPLFRNADIPRFINL